MNNYNDHFNERVVIKTMKEPNEKYAGCALAQDGR